MFEVFRPPIARERMAEYFYRLRRLGNRRAIREIRWRHVNAQTLVGYAVARDRGVRFPGPRLRESRERTGSLRRVSSRTRSTSAADHGLGDDRIRDSGWTRGSHRR